MSASNRKEIFNFVNKFLNLRENGEYATLSLNCQDGRLSINLQLHLSSCPPPGYKPHPSHRPSPCFRPTPSRLRRSARRAAARAESAEKADTNVFLPTFNFNTTEQVAARSTPTKTTDESNAIDEAEQASSSNEEVIQHHSHQLPAEQASPRCRPQSDCVNVMKTEEESRPVSNCTDVELDRTIDDEELTKANDGKISSDQPFELVCNYCNESFENEGALKDHTSIKHNSGRIRFRKIIKGFPPDY